MGATTKTPGRTCKLPQALPKLQVLIPDILMARVQQVAEDRKTSVSDALVYILHAGLCAIEAVAHSPASPPTSTDQFEEPNEYTH